MCLHENGKRGFTLHVFSFSLRLLAYDLILISFRPPDIALRGYMYFSIARKYSRAERPETPRGAVDSDQEACKEHLFTAKFRD
jgi:hypothetical protein